VIYFKATLAALAAAFVLSLYTAFVMSAKTRVSGRGALMAYYGTPLFWITLVVVCFYAFRVTTYR
jgi:hypothetical protein